jgi:hypothetical protein
VVIAGCFNQVYDENWEQEGLKKLQLRQGRVGAKEGMVSEKTGAINKKPSLCTGNRKDALRASQKLAKPYP